MHFRMMEWIKMGRTSIILFVILVYCNGCAVKQKEQEQPESTPQKFKSIVDIELVKQNNDLNMLIKGDEKLTYMSVKRPAPLGVIIHFPDTTLANKNLTVQVPENTIVKGVQLTELTNSNPTTKVEVSLSKDVPYEVVPEKNNLRIVFQDVLQKGEMVESQTEEMKIAQTAKVAEESEKSSANTPEEATIPENEPPAINVAKKATALNKVETSPLEDGIRINLVADGTIEDYNTFTIKSPARIVFDINGVKGTGKKESIINVNQKWAKRIRHYSYPDRLRFVIDTKEIYLSAYKAKATENGLEIEINENEKNADSQKKISNKAPSKSKISSSKTWVNRVDFLTEEKGKSVIFIGTTQPISYKIDKKSDKEIVLHLLDTRLPARHQRELITRRFESAIDRIVPSQKGRETDLLIELREPVPYLVEQTQNLIELRFESSSMSPKAFEKAEEVFTSVSTSSQDISLASAENKDMTQSDQMGSTPSSDLSEPDATKIQKQNDQQQVYQEIKDEVSGFQNVNMTSRQSGQKYTGEKIALDFYETDIKNVFVILRDVSGKNFAIDKNVSGKVTMTLDKPVPWDQVLSLILKMNQLGMVYEDDIIRISTLETLKREEDLRREAMTSKLQTKEQEKALEPLVTEYIAINYSNAQKDVLPHLEKILTKERGQISVDDRTNLIIITDVTDVIEKAKQIVKKLDRVTQQVVIEARVVEANVNFSRALGTEWGIDGSPIKRHEIGGEYGYTLALNTPSPSNSSIGFNFARLTGTPLVLNAKLMAMESNGEGKIVSAPKVVTLDNKKASIKQGIEYPYAVVDKDDRVNVSFKEINLQLDVTPHVTTDNRIAIQVSITKNDIYVLTEEAPALSTKEVKTELLINDGDTIVIGGIIKSTSQIASDAVPYISNVPIIGALFKNKSNSKTNEELLIFITPRIVQLEQPEI